MERKPLVVISFNQTVCFIKLAVFLVIETTVLRATASKKNGHAASKLMAIILQNYVCFSKY